LAPGAAGPSPARSLSVRHKKARPGRPAPEGPERMRRTAEGGEFASRGIRLWPKGKFVERSRCWPNGLGLRPRITEGNELAMGSSCGPLLARDKRVSEMAGALNPRRRSRDPDLLLPPDPDGPPVLPPSREGVCHGKCRLAGNWLIVDDSDVGCSARSSCPHADGRRWPPKLFPRRQGGRCSCADRPVLGPWRLCSWGGMFLPLVHQGPSRLCPIRSRPPAGRRRRRTWTCV